MAFKPSRNNHVPFVPLVLHKLHAKEPLDARIVEAQIIRGMRPTNQGESKPDDLLDSHLADMGFGSTVVPNDLPHPYEAEISGLLPGSELNAREPIIYGRLQDTPLVMVNTKEDLTIMIEELKAFPEIAIDLEHHDMHSYQGFTCLIQLSSRDKDYIVDPFPLFDELTVLNEITCNPQVVKVLHGADRDILWLQRDFGVYIVNMFDTGQACRILGLPGGASLRNLYEVKCGFSPDKTHQTSDWRQRPLPKAMIAYARSDTHYLLYAYDMLKKDLDTREMILRVWNRSRDLTLQRYHVRQPKFEEMATKIGSKFGRGQLKLKNFAALESFLAWRDQDARESDISPLYCCPDQVCYVLAQKLPAANEIGRAIHPIPYPPRVRARAEEVVCALRLTPITPALAPSQPSQPADTPQPPQPVETPQPPQPVEMPQPSQSVETTQPAEMAQPSQPVEVPKVERPRQNLPKPVMGAPEKEYSLLPLFLPPAACISSIFADIASTCILVPKDSFPMMEEPVRVAPPVEVKIETAPLPCLRPFVKEVKRQIREVELKVEQRTTAKRRKKNRQNVVSPQLERVVPTAPVAVPPPPRQKAVVKQGKRKGKKKR